MTSTINVSNEVRDRLEGQAERAHRTLGEHLEHLADLGEREVRMSSFRAAFGSTSIRDRASWREETRAFKRIEG